MSSALNSEEQALSKELISEMEKYCKYEKANAREHYNNLADSYDGVYTRAGYPDPHKCAEQVA